MDADGPGYKELRILTLRSRASVGFILGLLVLTSICVHLRFIIISGI
jgi:hypothetical protein